MRSIERFALYTVIAGIAIFAVIVLFAVADVPAPAGSAPTSTVAPAPTVTPANAVPAATLTRRPTRDPSKATLRSAPGQTQVQMFDTISTEPNVTTMFSSGTQCTKLDGPTEVTISGMSMRFFKLECDGKTGYVNTKWVQ